MLVDTPIQAAFDKDCKARMLESLADTPPEFRDAMIPNYHAGCRRITPGDGYLEALRADNTRLSWDRIDAFTETGIRTVDGHEEEFDMIVCATGFDPSWLPQWKLVGRGGATLEDMWKVNPKAFFATQVNSLPNYGSVLSAISWTVDYLLNWVQRMIRKDIKTVCVKKDAVDDFNECSQEMLKRTVWAGKCHTLYKNRRDEGTITGVYAGSTVHFKNSLEKALNQGEHFDITWRSKNRF